MTTIEALTRVLWGRLQCRLLGRHATSVRTSRGYVVTFCTRCYGASVERREA